MNELDKYDELKFNAENSPYPKDVIESEIELKSLRAKIQVKIDGTDNVLDSWKFSLKQISDLKSQLKTNDILCDVYVNGINSLESQVLKMKGEDETATNIINELNSQITIYKKAIDQYGVDFKELIEENEAVDDKRIQLNKALCLAQDEIAKLKNYLEADEMVMKTLNEQVAKLKEELDRNILVEQNLVHLNTIRDLQSTLDKIKTFAVVSLSKEDNKTLSEIIEGKQNE